MRRIDLAAAALAAALVAAPAHAQEAPPILDAASVLAAPPADEALAAAVWDEARIAAARADVPADPFPVFAPILGEAFARERLPATARLFDRLRAEARPLVGAAKARWPRPRPPRDDAAPPCPGALPAGYADPDSYPSGHAVLGWAWALTLAELAPAHADALLARGRDYAESRVVCGLHFPSDVEAGRVLASALIARLHGEPGFRREFDTARRELARRL